MSLLEGRILFLIIKWLAFQKACQAGYIDILKLLVKNVQKTQDVETGAGDLLQMCLFSDNICVRDAMNEKNTNDPNFKLGEYLRNLKGMNFPIIIIIHHYLILINFQASRNMMKLNCSP